MSSNPFKPGDRVCERHGGLTGEVIAIAEDSCRVAYDNGRGTHNVAAFSLMLI